MTLVEIYCYVHVACMVVNLFVLGMHAVAHFDWHPDTESGLAAESLGSTLGGPIWTIVLLGRLAGTIVKGGSK